MPPFVRTECPKCKHKNRYDLAELRHQGTLHKGALYRGSEEVEEFHVTCERCGCPFKIIVARQGEGVRHVEAD